MFGRFFRKTSSLPAFGPSFVKELLDKERSEWERAVATAQNGPLVLLATSTGGHDLVRNIDSVLAIALTLAGARVRLLLCDHALPACEHSIISKFTSVSEFAKNGPASLCQGCFGAGYSQYEELGLPVLRYSQFLTAAQRQSARDQAAKIPLAEIAGFRQRSIAVGEHALAGALRFFARGDLAAEPDAEPVLRRYLEAALLSQMALEGLFQQNPVECVSFHHGIYIPQGIVGEVARASAVRVVNWAVAYRKGRFIFSHGDTYHRTLLDEPVSAWQSLSLTPELETAARDYLRSRWSGSQDWIYFHENPKEDLAELRAASGFTFERPTILLLTNVVWDAQLHYRANAFSSMLHWIEYTIQYFQGRPEVDLLIRVHPAEIRGGIPSRQLVVDEIARKFPRLPDNVHVIGPDRDVSTYALAQQCDAAIIYGTKTGVELTSMAVPVIVAGEAWIRNKGLTEDASSPEEYRGILDRLPFLKRLDKEKQGNALKYAFHFFFRRMIPLGCVGSGKKEGSPFAISAECLEALSPQNDPGLRIICKGIMEGTPFVFPSEKFQNEFPELK